MSTRLKVFATANDGTKLHWSVSAPTSRGPWPAVLGIHGGGFHEGAPSSPMQKCGPSLTQAGYIVFSAQYRLAPPGALAGQVSKGQYPDQTDDLQLAVNAIKKDPRCNGSVQFIGGSAGACHAAWFAALGLGAGIGMSAITAMDDQESLRLDARYAALLEAYAPGRHYEASPLYRETSASSPFMNVAYEVDSIPRPQFDLMDAKLTALGVKHESILLPGAGHSFDAWPIIKDRAIAFLNAEIGKFNY